MTEVEPLCSPAYKRPKRGWNDDRDYCLSCDGIFEIGQNCRKKSLDPVLGCATEYLADGTRVVTDPVTGLTRKDAPIGR